MKTFIRKSPWGIYFRDISDPSTDEVVAPIIKDLPPDRYGWGNGYVIIPKGHALYGKDYAEIDGELMANNTSPVEIHGGLTFSADAKSLDKEVWSEIDKDEDGWVVGFDTAHYDDNSQNCSKEFVIEETDRLRQQLSAI